jgi:hypothetical protein
MVGIAEEIRKTAGSKTAGLSLTPIGIARVCLAISHRWIPSAVDFDDLLRFPPLFSKRLLNEFVVGSVVQARPRDVAIPPQHTVL